MFVYQITNHITNKIYIGQHKGNNLQKYLQNKFANAKRNKKLGRFGSHLFNAMNKYPNQSDWTIHPLLSVDTKPELDQAEKDFITLFKTRDPEIGYNICHGGEGFTGTFSAESRAKMSAAHKKIWADPELRKNHDEAMVLRRGIPRPPQVGEAVRRMRTGIKVTDETKEKIRAARLIQPDPRLGKKHSEESKQRMSESKKGIPSAFRGRHHTDESKYKNSQAHIVGLQGQQFENVLVVSLLGTMATHASWSVRCVVCGEEGVVVRSRRVRTGDSHFARAHRHS